MVYYQIRQMLVQEACLRQERKICEERGISYDRAMQNN